MSDKYKVFKGKLHFVTITVVGWIDVFTRSEYCDEIIKNFNYCIEKKGLKVYAFCIMPSHIHFIADVEDGSLSDVLRDFKSYTAKKLLSIIEENIEESRKEWMLYMFEFFAKKNSHNSKYQFWQQNNHAFYLYSAKMIQQKVDYIHNNPITACVTDEAHHYIYSSANEFTEMKLSQI